MAHFRTLIETLEYASKRLKELIKNGLINEAINTKFCVSDSCFVIRRLPLYGNQFNKIMNGNEIKFSRSDFVNFIYEKLLKFSGDGISSYIDYNSMKGKLQNEFDMVQNDFSSHVVTEDTLKSICNVFNISCQINSNDYLNFMLNTDMSKMSIIDCSHEATFGIACFKVGFLKDNGISVITSPTFEGRKMNDLNHALLLNTKTLDYISSEITEIDVLKKFLNDNSELIVKDLTSIDNGRSVLSTLAEIIADDISEGRCTGLISPNFNDKSTTHFVICNYHDYDIINFRRKNAIYRNYSNEIFKCMISFDGKYFVISKS